MGASATDDEAVTDDELPALVDGSSDEDEPVLVGASPGKPDSINVSLGKPDFFVTLITVDEFSCARRQGVMATAFALRNLALETQSRGKLHAHTRMTVPHGFLYVAHSRVKNAASVDVNTYVANYVAKGRSASEQLEHLRRDARRTCGTLPTGMGATSRSSADAALR